jgi:hypothetical protein
MSQSLSNIDRTLRIEPLIALSFLLGGCAVEKDVPGPVLPVATVVAENATYPTVAVSSASGRGFVAWVGIDGDVYNVYLASADPGSTSFSSPVRVNDIPGDVAPHEQAPAQVVAGPDEEVYLLWQNNTVVEGRRFPASDLRLAVSLDGGRTFGPAVTVNDDAGELPSSHTFHNMAVGEDGTVYVSWIDSRQQDRARALGHGDHHDVSGPEIRFSFSTDRGASFQPSVVVDTNSCPCCRTGLAVGDDGNVYVAWRKIFPGEVRDIVVAGAEPGSSEFGSPVRVAEDDWVFPGCPHAGPSLKADEQGRLHVGWYTGESDRQGIWHTTSADHGRSFERGSALLTDDWVPPSLVALTRAGEGMIAVWEDRTVEPASVVIGRIDEDGVPASGSVRLGSGRSPAIDSGREWVLVAWLDRDAIRAAWTEQ